MNGVVSMHLRSRLLTNSSEGAAVILRGVTRYYAQSMGKPSCLRNCMNNCTLKYVNLPSFPTCICALPCLKFIALCFIGHRYHSFSLCLNFNAQNQPEINVVKSQLRQRLQHTGIQITVKGWSCIAGHYKQEAVVQLHDVHDDRMHVFSKQVDSKFDKAVETLKGLMPNFKVGQFLRGVSGRSQIWLMFWW